MAIRNPFTAHPASVGESYLEHLRSATGFGARMFFASIACLLHGLFPFAFEKTGSNCVRRLHQRMIVSRAKPAATRPHRFPIDEACES